MKKIIFITLCFYSLLTFGQQTGTFYYSVLGERCSEKSAKSKIVVSKQDNNTYKEKIQFKYDNIWSNTNSYSFYHFENDTSVFQELFIEKKLVKTTKRIFKPQNDSILSFIDYENGILTQKGFALNILPLIYDGKIETFYSNGEKSSESIYIRNRLISNSRWEINGEKDIDNVFDFEKVELEPKFSEGSLVNYIKKNIKYPKEALKESAEGRVILQLVVMEDGSIDGIKILRGVNQLLDNEAIRVLTLTNKKWIPGKINNIPVRVAINIPIVFML